VERHKFAIPAKAIGHSPAPITPADSGRAQAHFTRKARGSGARKTAGARETGRGISGSRRETFDGTDLHRFYSLRDKRTRADWRPGRRDRRQCTGVSHSEVVGKAFARGRLRCPRLEMKRRPSFSRKPQRPPAPPLRVSSQTRDGCDRSDRGGTRG
jgi:hypothetical protein